MNPPPFLTPAKNTGLSLPTTLIIYASRWFARSHERLACVVRVLVTRYQMWIRDEYVMSLAMKWMYLQGKFDWEFWFWIYMNLYNSISITHGHDLQPCIDTYITVHIWRWSVVFVRTTCFFWWFIRAATWTCSKSWWGFSWQSKFRISRNFLVKFSVEHVMNRLPEKVGGLVIVPGWLFFFSAVRTPWRVGFRKEK